MVEHCRNSSVRPSGAAGRETAAIPLWNRHSVKTPSSSWETAASGRSSTALPEYHRPLWTAQQTASRLQSGTVSASR